MQCRMGLVNSELSQLLSYNCSESTPPKLNIINAKNIKHLTP